MRLPAQLQSARSSNTTSSLGLSCQPTGVSLAGAPLLRRTTTGFAPRPRGEIDALMKAAYGQQADSEPISRGLSVVADALNRGDLGHAMVGAVRLRLPELSWDRAVRIARAQDALAKYNFNPDEPRDRRGRWTSGGGGSLSEPPTPTTSKPSGQTDQESDTSQAAPEASSTANVSLPLTPIAYNGRFHDQVVAAKAADLRSKGEIVVTEVRLQMADGSGMAKIDILAFDPKYGILYGVEVKTGNNPGFTPSQLLVYPHLMMGGSVISIDPKSGMVGAIPDVPLPPMPMYLMYQRDGNSEKIFGELNPKNMKRYYRGENLFRNF